MMTTSSEIDRDAKLRKAAILVASLDEPLAERLLAGLPAHEATMVRKLAAQLKDVDPVEHQAVVTDFRKAYSAPTLKTLEHAPLELDGVELDASLLARLDDEASFPTTHPSTSPETCHWQALSDADTTTLVEILKAEQPQTIAVVLARLQSSRAADLLSQLSPTLQIEVLTRLEQHNPADERALEVVGKQLAAWITQQSQQRQRMAAGRELVQRILQDTPETQRSVLLARLDRPGPRLTEQPGSKGIASSPLPEPTNDQLRTSRPLPRSGTPDSEFLVNPAALSTDPLSDLEALDDQALLRALQTADRHTVMLALVGASEDLMKRIVQGLPRRRAKQFRQQVRAIGPTRLGDMLTAQRQLLRCSQA